MAYIYYMDVYNQQASNLSQQSACGLKVSDVRPEQAPFYFNAVLYPQRSLSRYGVAFILSIFIIHGLVMGGYFYAQGAWPIPGFFGLEVLLVIWLFVMHHKSGQSYESICLTENKLIVQNHNAWRSHESSGAGWVFEPAWVKVFAEKDRNDNTQLKIISHGKGVIVGEFLNDDEKEDLAESLRHALNKWRADMPFR